MASIPADSKAFIKPFEGTDVTCLIVDVVAWFGADEVVAILNQNLSSALKNLPLSQKALWRQIEPQVNSDKQFITSLGVRLLIGRSQNIECGGANVAPSSSKSYYNNTLLDTCPASTVCYNNPRFELSRSMHNFGNIFINEAIYDARAYPQLEEVYSQINRIYDLLLSRENPIHAE
ncbi:PEP-1 [Plodia interpunctella granulovirus]|uniref:PEP-1 n=1 Tax=Plodia interpunctella granulovirus TaxID=262175 RepID=A0A1L5JGI8_9BBAC|nr:PEP-1 [Plodia interpunctella granulovirus]APO13903.1 PEP-1 [Plodia interpunctella granulovirus]